MTISELEAAALAGDAEAVARLIEAGRLLRDAASALLRSRYQDGECDAYAIALFAGTIEQQQAVLEGTHE